MDDYAPLVSIHLRTLKASIYGKPAPRVPLEELQRAIFGNATTPDRRSSSVESFTLVFLCLWAPGGIFPRQNLRAKSSYRSWINIKTFPSCISATAN